MSQFFKLHFHLSEGSEASGQRPFHGKQQIVMSDSVMTTPSSGLLTHEIHRIDLFTKLHEAL